MFRFFQKLTLILCLLLPAVASAQDKKTPEILFLGDSVHQEIVQGAAKELGAAVNIRYPKGITANNSSTALENIEKLLGETKWDIIYFNFGIGDLFYKDPSIKENRIMSKHGGGVRVSTPAQYEKQLDALAEQLKKTNAKLIWGNTTPMVVVHFFPSYQGNILDENGEKEYNAIAARVMAKHKIPVVDLHAHAMAQFKPDEKHPGYTQYAKELTKRGAPLHTPLVKVISSAAEEMK